MVRGKRRTLATETKVTWHHQNLVLSPQQVLDTTTQEKQDSDLKSHLMMMTEDFRKDINNSLKEIQENTGKQVEALKKETEKSLKELQKNTIKQVKELKKKKKPSKI
jgi:ribosome recycling factor